LRLIFTILMTFYDNINDYFEKDDILKNVLNEPMITIFHSKIIKSYKDILKGSDEYFEDKVMNTFDEYFDRYENADAYDDICNQIIIIYYNSNKGMKEYYSSIFKKERFYL